MSAPWYLLCFLSGLFPWRSATSVLPEMPHGGGGVDPGRARGRMVAVVAQGRELDADTRYSPESRKHKRSGCVYTSARTTSVLDRKTPSQRQRDNASFTVCSLFLVRHCEQPACQKYATDTSRIGWEPSFLRGQR